MKPSDEVISEFNEHVNMTADELEEWLKSGDSNSAGWPKDDAEGDGETVGHDSGRKIVEILRENPDKSPDKYTEEQVEHMRKVVAYCKRHLAQEAKGNSEKSEEEVKKTKSYASLKNWGHDFLKAKGGSKGASKGDDKKREAEEKEEKEEEESAEGKDDNDTAKAGDKRKQADDQNGSSSKKRETRQGEGAAAEDDKDEKKAEAKNGDEEEEVSEEDPDDDGGEAKTTKGPKKGDTVSWNWGNGQPEGEVLDVKGEKTTITTKKGNEVSRDGKPEDPAVVIDTGKSKAIKSSHELN